MRTNKRHQMKYKGRLRTALLGFAALALAIVGISVGVSSASAADPYANLKASEFKWEKWWDQGGRAEAKPMTESTRLFLEQQGIRCEGGVCRPSGERPIPETLDLSGRDLRDVTFRDLVVTNMMTNATNLTNAKFENLQLNGTWNAVELLAKNMVVTGVGAGTSQVPTGRLEGTWTRSNVEGMRLSNLDLSNRRRLFHPQVDQHDFGITADDIAPVVEALAEQNRQLLKKVGLGKERRFRRLAKLLVQPTPVSPARRSPP